MFCYQCQETLSNKGCTNAGVCGKTSDMSDLQDVLIYALKGVSFCVERTRPQEIDTKTADDFVCDSLFLTLTNTCFDKAAIEEAIIKACQVREDVKRAAKKKANDDSPCKCVLPPEASINPKNSEEIHILIAAASILNEKNEDIRSLKELLIYGLKGTAAYAAHAAKLGYECSDFYRFMHKGLAYTISPNLEADKLLELILSLGAETVKVLQILDKANTETFGIQEITTVSKTLSKNKAILISGHDLLDLYELLEQTAGKNIDIYTHGEMLTAHAYPKLKKFKHLKGHFGSSWANQQTELENFAGAILFTTNCIQKPKASYAERVFTTGPTYYENIPHIADRSKDKQKDFSQLIEKALKCNDLTPSNGGELTIGFGKDTVMSVADKVVGAIKSGDIKRLAVMAGCDGRHKERSYFTEVAKTLPKSTVILTAGCAKYRYNDLDLGNIGGIPRVLDAGQCNDCYSLAYVALQLKDAFALDDINKLPIDFYVAWYEQKAVAVLLALLHLGFKNIRIGTTLPAFLSNNVAQTLISNFGLQKTDTPIHDIVM